MSKRVYKFLNSTYGLLDLKQRRLKLSMIDELNDPFDLFNVVNKSGFWLKLSMPELIELGRSFGILCLSRNWDNLLLWSHYADGHRGVCLGFDIVESPSVIDLRYQPNLIQPDELLEALKDPTKGTDVVMRMLTTKHEGWSYEQEVRVFSDLNDPPENGRHFFGFRQDFKLREVITGVKCCAERVADIRAVLKDYGEEIVCSSAYMRSDAFLLDRLEAS